MTFLGIIPARYASTRFPGKPLIKLLNKPLIQWVYEQVKNTLDQVIVATDDERIYQTVEALGGQAVLTSVHHQSGTDRCYEAYTLLNKPYDVILNIQGDEPFISSHHIQLIKECFSEQETQIATLVKPFDLNESFEDLFNPNVTKVIVKEKRQALYFSRSVIPYYRGADFSEWLKKHTYYKHIGLYGYRSEILKEIKHLPMSSLEQAESLEQLRWIENGYTIRIEITQEETVEIDTPEDLEKALQFINAKHYYR